MSLDQVREVLIAYSEQKTPGIFTFTFENFLQVYSQALDPQVMREVLNKWAFSFSDLEQNKPAHFFMANPIWSRPLICLEKDVYFRPVTELF